MPVEAFTLCNKEQLQLLMAKYPEDFDKGELAKAKKAQLDYWINMGLEIDKKNGNRESYNFIMHNISKNELLL